VGGSATVLEWESGYVRRVIRGRNAIPGGARETAALGGDLSERDGVELSRRLDVSGRAFEQWFNESWASGLAENTMRRRAEQKYDPLGGSKVLPLISYPVLEAPSGEGIAPYFKDWLAHPNFDEYWKRISIEDHYAQIQVPVYGMGAWYDIFWAER